MKIRTHAEGGNRGRWTAGVLAAVLLAVEAVIVAESWRGLTGFAHLIGISGPWAWGVPVTLDGVSLVAALTALRAELVGESSGIYRLTLFGFTGASAAANWWHAKHASGTEAALYLGGMSLAVAWVFALALRQIRSEDRRRAGTVTARLPRFSAAHWGRYPGLTWRAWSLAVRDGHTSPRSALDAALGRPPVTGHKDGHGAASDRTAGTSGDRSAKTATADSDRPDDRTTAPRRGRSQGRPKKRPGPARTRRSAADMEAAALTALSGHPDMTGPELATAIGTSDRTARRIRARLSELSSEAPGPGV